MADIIDDDLAEPVLDGIIKKLPPPPPLQTGMDYPATGEGREPFEEWVGAKFHIFLFSPRSGGGLRLVAAIGRFKDGDVRLAREIAGAAAGRAVQNAFPTMVNFGVVLKRAEIASDGKGPRYGIVVASAVVNGNPPEDFMARHFEGAVAAAIHDGEGGLQPWEPADQGRFTGVVFQAGD